VCHKPVRFSKSLDRELYSADRAPEPRRPTCFDHVPRCFGALIVTLDSPIRMSSNPFFPYMLERIEEGIPGGVTGARKAAAAPAAR